MYRNYLKIALRTLLKQKTFSAIKIGGFALSIAACLLIALFIRNELSYDKFYPDTARLFRVTLVYSDKWNVETGASWPAPMAVALEQNFPEVQEAGRLNPSELFYGAGSNEIRRTDHQENSFEQGFTYADQGMLDILQMPMIYGKREVALAEPNTMVITKKVADKFFPGENPLRKLMILNNDPHKTYQITGVIPDFPATSHIQYDFLLTLSGYQFWQGEQDDWGPLIITPISC